MGNTACCWNGTRAVAEALHNVCGGHERDDKAYSYNAGYKYKPEFWMLGELITERHSTGDFNTLRAEGQ